MLGLLFSTQSDCFGTWSVFGLAGHAASAAQATPLTAGRVGADPESLRVSAAWKGRVNE